MKEPSKSLLKQLELPFETTTGSDSHLNEEHSNYLLQEGIKLHKNADPLASLLFDVAEELSPDNPELLHKIALCLFKNKKRSSAVANLTKAQRKLRKAIKIKPHSLPYIKLAAKTLFKLAKKSKQHHFYLEARSHFEKAFSLMETSSDEYFRLHQDYALTLLEIARKTQELGDFKACVGAFKECEKNQKIMTDQSWLQYGHTLLELIELLDNDLLYQEAQRCFSIALTKNEHLFEARLYHAVCIKHMFITQFDKDFFDKANNAFEKCAQLNPRDIDVFVEWADLLLVAAQREQSTALFKSSLDKIENALQINTQDHVALGIKAKALGELGLATDSLNMIKNAEEIIEDALERHPDYPCVYEACGFVYECLYHYFSDLDYLFRAVEKYQEGLSKNRAAHQLWYHMGRCYLIASEIEADVDMIEKAADFMSKALYYKPKRRDYIFEQGLISLKKFELYPMKHILDGAIYHMEYAIKSHTNILHLDPRWLFNYCTALDYYAEVEEEPDIHIRAIEIISHLLLMHPNYPGLRHKCALFYAHYAEQVLSESAFEKAQMHFAIAGKFEEDNEQFLNDWATNTMHYAELTFDDTKRYQLLHQAELKLLQASKLGSGQAYYYLGCLYAMMSNASAAMAALFHAKKYDGLPHAEDMIDEVWLDSVKDDPLFSQLLEDNSDE